MGAVPSLKDNWKLAIILLVQIALLGLIFRPGHFLWWDECTNVLLAKSVALNPFSFETGVIGLHIESFRPHLLPWLIAIFGGSPEAGLYLVILSSFLAIILFYKFVETELGSDAAALSSIALMASFWFLHMSTRLYNDVPALPLAFTTLLLAQRKMAKEAGVAFGLAALMRYTNFIIIFPVAFMLLKGEKKNVVQALLPFAISAAAILSIQLVLSDFLVYGLPFVSPIHQLLIFSNSPVPPQIFYYLEMFFSENPLLTALSIAGIAIAFVEKRSALLVWFFSTYLFLELPLMHKEPRYVLALMPLFGLFAGLFMARVGESLQKATKINLLKNFLFVAAALLLIYPVSGRIASINSLEGGDPLFIKSLPLLDGKTIITNWHIEYKCHLNATVYSLWFKDDLTAAKDKLDYAVIYVSEYGGDAGGYSQNHHALLGDDFVLEKNITESEYKIGRVEIFRRK
ncbi:MAG: glycosyltransferase family 39 protein [Candidatus Micrarchaeota archaeon]